jgi:hypothetical protein
LTLVRAFNFRVDEVDKDRAAAAASGWQKGTSFTKSKKNMPEEYLVLINGDEVRGDWEADKDQWKKYVAAKYTKMLVKGGLAYAVNHFTLSIGGVIFEGPGLYKTDQHIKRLLEIQSRKDVQEQYPCTCKDPPCSDILLYTIGQKLKKYQRRIVGSLPVVGTAETVRAKIGGAFKTERGERGLNTHNSCIKGQTNASGLRP